MSECLQIIRKPLFINNITPFIDIFLCGILGVVQPNKSENFYLVLKLKFYL